MRVHWPAEIRHPVGVLGSRLSRLLFDVSDLISVLAWMFRGSQKNAGDRRYGIFE